MNKKKILVLCPTQRDIHNFYQHKIQNNYEIIYAESSRFWLKQFCKLPEKSKNIDSEIEFVLDDIGDYVINNDINAIVSSSDYPANVMRVAINNRIKKPGPSIFSLLTCEHKYYSRLLQQKVIPQAVPQFFLAKKTKKKTIQYPVIIKPVKSRLGKNAFIVNSKEEFAHFLKKAPLPPNYLKLFNFFLTAHTSFEYDANNVIVENFIQGYQTTVEGFVYKNEVTLLGIVDSIMFPNTISFMRFEYPSSLEQSVQERMGEIAKQAIISSQLDNTLFNVECVYNPETDTIIIIEINPRISSQFADLFERVDGFNTYETLIELALGSKPVLKKREGNFKCAASCVLRIFEDQFVQKIPSQGNIGKVKSLFPDMYIEILTQAGKKLSDEDQDCKSYRYGLIHLGAYDHEDLLNRFNICKQLLDFRFKPVR